MSLQRLKTVAVLDADAHTALEQQYESGGMSRRDKLVARLKGRPKDFTWDELVKLLAGLDYAEAVTGKTGGSRRRFVHATAPIVMLHKPHPGKIVKMYVIDNLLRMLTEEGLI